MPNLPIVPWGRDFLKDSKGPIIRISPGGISWLLRDEFSDVRAAGAVNGTPAKPGPGGNRGATDVESKLSIVNGSASWAAQTTPAWNDQRLWYGDLPIVREAGRLIFAKVAYSVASNNFTLAIANTATPNYPANYLSSFSPYGGFIQCWNGTVSIETSPVAVDTDYYMCIVLRSTGVYFFIKGGIYTYWTLLWITDTISTSPLYIAQTNYNGAMVNDYIRVPSNIWLPTPLAYDDLSSPPSITDESAHGYDATINDAIGLTGATNGARCLGEGRGVIQFADTGLHAEYNSGNAGQEGGFIVQIAAPVASYWDEADANDRFFQIVTDDGDYLLVRKQSGDDIGWIYRAGAASKSRVKYAVDKDTVPKTIAGSWSKTSDIFQPYYNGVAEGAALTSLGTWTGDVDPNQFLAGGGSLAGALNFAGYIKNLILVFNVVPSADDHSNIHTKLTAGTLTASDLDTYFGSGKWSWWKMDEIYSTLSSGPDSQEVTAYDWVDQGTWGIENGCMVNTPSPGDELVSNSDFSAWTGDDPDDFTITESPPNSEVSEVGSGEGHGGAGNGAANFYTDGTALQVSQAICTVGKFYRAYLDVSYDNGGQLSIIQAIPTLVYSSVTATVGSIRKTSDTTLYINRIGATDMTVDEFSCKELPFNQLIRIIDLGKTDVYLQMKVTTFTGYHGFGLVMNVDDPDDPQNFVLAYFDGINRYCLLKYVSGTVTEVEITINTLFVGGYMKLIRDGNDVSFFYGNTKIGSTQTISDAEIVDNTYHGVFSTHPGAQLDEFLAMVRGKDGEYEALDRWSGSNP
jgi:hypothetical protein